MSRYFNVNEELREVFIKLPKVFFEKDSKYYYMSLQARVIYGIFQDRMQLSLLNSENWKDEKGNIYFYFNQELLSEKLGMTRKTARKYIIELEKFELLERRRQGLNKADKLYLLKVEVPQSLETSLMGNFYPSRRVISTHQEGYFLPTNNNELNNNKINNNKSSSREDEDNSVNIKDFSVLDKKNTHQQKADRVNNHVSTKDNKNVGRSQLGDLLFLCSENDLKVSRKYLQVLLSTYDYLKIKKALVRMVTIKNIKNFELYLDKILNEDKKEVVVVNEGKDKKLKHNNFKGREYTKKDYEYMEEHLSPIHHSKGLESEIEPIQDIPRGFMITSDNKLKLINSSIDNINVFRMQGYNLDDKGYIL